MPLEKKRKDKTADFLARNRKALLGALTLTLLLLAGGIVLFFRAAPSPPPPAAVQQETEIAVVDLERVMRVHEAYGQLEELSAQREEMALDIRRLSAMSQAIIPPELKEEPFQRAAEQKELQKNRALEQELARDRRRVLAAWEEETNPEFLARKKAVEDEYQNRLVNIEMKLDNRKAMGLSDDETAALADELGRLRRERGERLEALFEAREAEIRAKIAALTAQDQAKMPQARTADEAARERAEAERRNSEALAARLQSLELKEILRRKREALAAKDEEIRIIREHIRKDIEAKAAKLAIVHRVALILVKETGGEATAFSADESMPAFPVVAPGAIDLTEELIAEFKS